MPNNSTPKEFSTQSAAAANPFPPNSVEAGIFAVGTDPDHMCRLQEYWASPECAAFKLRMEEARIEGGRRTAAGEQPWQQPGFFNRQTASTETRRMLCVRDAPE